MLDNPKNLELLLKHTIQNDSPSGRSPIVAAGIGLSGKVLLGVCVELPGFLPHKSINAEQFLLANLALNSETQLTHLAITPDGDTFDASFGYFRQFLHAIRDAPSIKVLIKAKGEGGRFETLPNLPAASSFFRPLPLEPQDNNLTILYQDLVGNICADPTMCNHLNCTALAAANKSYTPLTKSPSGVALLDNKGHVYRGWFIETEEDGLSLGPLEAALVDFVARGGGDFNSIVQAVLVEMKDVFFSKEETTRMILNKISNGKCLTNVLLCNISMLKSEKSENIFLLKKIL